MPPIRKIQKQDIINATLEIAKNEDFECVNARKIAKKLDCSVQPIFHNFENMEDLKNEVVRQMYKIYQNYMKEGSMEENGYKGMGMAYIKFAKDYPRYFKVLFMNETKLSPDKFILEDDTGNNVIQKGMELTGFSYEEQKEFHLKVWIFTHGIATLVATNTVKISEDEIGKLLQETVREMINGRKKG